MRLVGTGEDPENRYPEGLVFDAPPHIAQKHIEAGHAVAQDPKDDVARTESQIAAAVQRGDNLSDPVDHELAGEFRGEGENPDQGPDALSVVHGTPVDEPVLGGAVAKAPVGTTSKEDPAAVQAAAEEGDTSATETPDGDAGSGTDSGEKELTPKQQAVERAKELDISHSGTEAEIRERIEAKEKELEAENAPPSDELVQRAEKLGVDADGTTAEVEARIAAKEAESGAPS